MMQARRWVIGSSLALGVLLPLLVGAWLASDPRPARQLPNGSTLWLSGIRYGPTSQLALGPPWKRQLFPLAGYLPGPMVDRIGWDVRDLASYAPADSLLVATETEAAPADLGPSAVLVDSHGCRFVPEGVPEWEPGAEVHLDAFPFFPRREPGCQLELFRPHEANRAPLATFPVGNPVGTSYPTWTPDALPATRSSGALTVTLTEATLREDSAGSSSPAGGPELRLRFRTTSAGPAWTLLGLSLSDATGGFYHFPSGRHPQQNSFTAHVGLCRNETYSCKLEFSRGFIPRAEPDRIHDLGGWTLNQLSETKVTLQDGRPADLIAVPVRGGVWLRLDWNPGENEVGRLLATTAGGRAFESAPPIFGSYRSGPGVFIPAGEKRLRVRFGTFQTQTVVFQMKPSFNQLLGE